VFPNLQNIPSPIFYFSGKDAIQGFSERTVSSGSAVISAGTANFVSQDLSESAITLCSVLSATTNTVIIGQSITDEGNSFMFIASASVSGSFQRNISDAATTSAVVLSAINYGQVLRVLSEVATSGSLILSANV
jgi:hypothetical protein